MNTAQVIYGVQKISIVEAKTGMVKESGHVYHTAQLLVLMEKVSLVFQLFNDITPFTNADLMVAADFVEGNRVPVSVTYVHRIKNIAVKTGENHSTWGDIMIGLAKEDDSFQLSCFPNDDVAFTTAEKTVYSVE